MDRKQIAYLNMSAVVQVTCDAHAEAWTDFPAFAGPYPRLAILRQAATAANAMQQTISEGTTASKAILRAALTTNMMQLADTLVLWGLTTGASLQLAKDAQTSKSRLDVSAEENLVGRAQKLLSLTPGANGTPPTPPTALADLGITATFITQFKASIIAFTDAQGTPGHVRAESVRGTNDLAGVIDDLRDLFKELDPAARVLQYTQPTFFAEYTSSRRINDAGYSVRDLAVTIRDSATAAPLRGVQCMINPIGIAKETGEAGSFYIDDMAGGAYQMTLSFPGYYPKTIDFTIVDGQATVIDETMTVISGGAGD